MAGPSEPTLADEFDRRCPQARGVMSFNHRRWPKRITTLEDQPQRFQELSPSQYVLARRIEYVRQLLVQTGHSIAEIGAMAGFYDQSHFTRKFCSVTGITPTQYRKHFGRQ